MKYINVAFKSHEGEGEYAVLTLDNPETKNSLTLDTGLAFQGQLNSMAAREPLPAALIITGGGDAFSSGGDFEMLRRFSENTVAENREFMLGFYKLFLRVREVPFPVIAAVNGHAMGAAFALALACDIRYFAQEGKYAMNFVRLGIHPGMGSSFILKEIAGLGQAQDLLLTGKTISGEEVQRRGLCHEALPASRIMERAEETARQFAQLSPEAVQLCKAGLYRNHSLEETLNYEAESQARNYASDEYRLLMDALVMKHRKKN